MELNNRNHFILLICLFCFVGCLKSLRADEKIEPKGHWAFQSIKRPHVPDEFTRDPIRWFILKALDEAKIPMSSSADRRDWIRRLYYNLTGLPPSYSELIKLENDKRSDSEISRELVEVLLGKE